jgi:hypothetical protein
MTDFIAIAVAGMLALQPAAGMERLIAAVRPVLPFPDARAGGDLPIDNSAASKWFVVWPGAPDETRIIVRANPLHPDVQQASAEAMEAINAAVAVAERKAQAAYDRALEQLRKTGKAGELEPVTLDDEGVAGQRIDAELEVTIDLTPATSFEIDGDEAPAITAGAGGPTWIVSVTAHTYSAGEGKERREQFRAAESRLLFGVPSRPDTTRLRDAPRFRVAITPSATAFAVVIRGNATLVAALTSEADWTLLAAR